MDKYCGLIDGEKVDIKIARGECEMADCEHCLDAITREETKGEKCPGCGCHNPSDKHLLYEYHDLKKAGFDTMFGHNARRACNDVIDMLAKRGITEIMDIFGIRPIAKWTY